MAHQIDPVVDNWYLHLDKGQRFQVTDFNEVEGTVEVQYFDGDLEEIDMANWYEMDIVPGEEPESWGGAIDIDEIDDYGTEITDTTLEDWNEESLE